MAQTIDMLETYYRKANLPQILREDSSCPSNPEVLKLVDSIKNHTFAPSIIVFSGIGQGKTRGAAAMLREYLKTRRDVIDNGTPGYFLSVHSLCYQNRSVDRYKRDEDLQQVIRTAINTDFLVLDGIFSYLTQNDDLLLQSLYDARQYSGKTTVVTTSIIDPLDCSGSVLYRISRDANVKVEFKNANQITGRSNEDNKGMDKGWGKTT